MKWGKHATDWAGNSPRLLGLHYAILNWASSSTGTFDASSGIHQLQLLSREWDACKEVRQKWALHSLGEGNWHRTAAVQSKMLQWACMATRDTEDQLLSWLTSAGSHYQKTQDVPTWLGQWEMIQASLYCASSVSGHHTTHPHVKSALGRECCNGKSEPSVRAWLADAIGAACLPALASDSQVL